MSHKFKTHRFNMEVNKPKVDKMVIDPVTGELIRRGSSVSGAMSPNVTSQS
jgi:hypothetical protein